MNFKSDFLREINSRGFIYQSSNIDSLDDLMSKKKSQPILVLILQVTVFTLEV